jgi:hypothetical protein
MDGMKLDVMQVVIALLPDIGGEIAGIHLRQPGENSRKIFCRSSGPVIA